MSAQSSDKFTKVGSPGTATTLAAPGHTIGGTSLVVGSTSNWPTDTGVVFAMDTVTLVNGVETRDVGTYTEWEGVVNSATGIGSLVLKKGTDQNYPAGSTTRVYIPVAGSQNDQMVDALLADHSQAGAHEIATNFDPSNPTLETQKWVGVASAVNELTVTNAATSTPVRQAATGGDTNIDMYLKGKGAGSARYAGPYDGWVAADETLTYASATTFTCSAALAAALSVGDKIKLTQTTVKYFYVTAISGTTVTINGGSDYTLANAAITLPFYSHESSPAGFPDWFSYSPTVTNFTLGNGSVSARFKMLSKTVESSIKLVMGSSSSISGTVTFTLPVTAASKYSTGAWIVGMAWFDDNGIGNYQGISTIGNSTTILTTGPLGAASTYIGPNTSMNATVPFTWGSADVYTTQFSYEPA